MKNIIKLSLIAMLSFMVVGCGNAEADRDVEKTVSKLENIAELEKEDDRYAFDFLSANDNEWNLIYVEDNEFVEFFDERITERFIEQSEEYCFFENASIVYDFSDNELRMYFDEDVIGFSIISYSISDDEFILRKDNDDYHPSDEFSAFIEKYKLVEIMKNDVEKFKEDLEEVDITFEEVKRLNYSNLDNYFN